jgi:hypothetical protein
MRRIDNPSRANISATYSKRQSKLVALLFIGIIILIGSYLLFVAHAGISASSAEVEAGAVVAPAAVTSDAGASGGKAVTFTSPPVALNPKKGVGASKYINSISKLMALNTSWTYNWGSTNPPADKGGMDYVPMIWGSGSATQARANTLAQGKKDGLYTSLLGFNEPDHTGQSNMTVSSAINLWPILESTGLRLGSPAVTSPTSQTNTSTPGVAWLDDFMTKAAANNYRVDFIALHYYQDWTNPNAVSSLQNSLTTVYNKYHKPIWITEIGSIDIKNDWGAYMSGPATFTGAQTYMKNVIPMLNSLPFVERYAWFADNKWNSANPTSPSNYTSLYDASDNLTDLGIIYKGLN